MERELSLPQCKLVYHLKPTALACAPPKPVQVFSSHGELQVFKSEHSDDLLRVEGQRWMEAVKHLSLFFQHGTKSNTVMSEERHN